MGKKLVEQNCHYNHGGFSMWIKQTIGEQRKTLTTLFEPAMLNIAKRCAQVWSEMDKLDQVLSTHFALIPHCHLLYAIDKFGKQVSSNIASHTIDPSYREQDLSRRPFSVSLYPKRHFMLSSVYISQTTGCPCISAVQPVIDHTQQFLGFVVADFDLRQLPLTVVNSNHPYLEKKHKKSCGIPSVRVQRSNTGGRIEQYFDDIQGILYKLISEHGVFQFILHYTSMQVIIWQVDDPYQYQRYSIEQLLDPNMYLVYPRHPYLARAKISPPQVQEVLGRFHSLRLVDEQFYLRSGSLNIINGIVSLSFSHEGSLYVPVEIFLSKDQYYWIGNASAINAN
jgi:hypothetical protein